MNWNKSYDLMATYYAPLLQVNMVDLTGLWVTCFAKKKKQKTKKPKGWAQLNSEDTVSSLHTLCTDHLFWVERAGGGFEGSFV